MLWIAGSMAILLLGTVLMCILIVGGRADDRMELSKLIQPSIRVPSSGEDKIRVVLEGLHNEISVFDLCKREGISPVLYYSWLRDFMEAGKARLRGESLRNVPQSRVEELKEENVLLRIVDG